MADFFTDLRKDQGWWSSREKHLQESPISRDFCGWQRRVLLLREIRRIPAWSFWQLCGRAKKSKLSSNA